VARLQDARGGLVDDVVAIRVAEDELEIIAHGGPGIRAAIDAALDAHGAAHSLPPDAGDGRWRQLAAASSPAAVRWLLTGSAGAAPFPPAFLTRPAVVLITGPANAGKSTLLNAWCGWGRALISEQPGTTRDLVEAETVVAGWRLRLVDSAGMRPTADVLEQAGQELVEGARQRADVVLCLVPPGPPVGARPGDLLVDAKADLQDGPGAAAAGRLRWSALGLPGRTRAELLAELGAAVLARLRLPPGGGAPA
jgi:hypothetical protein